MEVVLAQQRAVGPNYLCWSSDQSFMSPNIAVMDVQIRPLRSKPHLLTPVGCRIVNAMSGHFASAAARADADHLQLAENHLGIRIIGTQAIQDRSKCCACDLTSRICSAKKS